MRFPLRSVDDSFFATAPWRFINAVELPASAAEVFGVFEDGAQWPLWFKGIRRVIWTSPKPHGVGTTRTVELDTLTVYERFFRWQSGERFSFDLTAATAPIFRALAEDYADLPHVRVAGFARLDPVGGINLGRPCGT